MGLSTSTSFSAPDQALVELPRRGRGITLLGWIALLALVAGQMVAFRISAPDRDMGNLQKIMYVHVPAAWLAFVAFFVVFVVSLLYLWKRDWRHDLLAAAAAEVGVVLTALTLVLGMIWARPTWGVWWTWDPRLTTTAILLVIYAGYMALRGFVEDSDRRGVWSAAVGILSFLNVPVVYMSVRWWRSIHQVQSSPATVDPAYALGLRVNAVAFLLVALYFLLRRYHAARLEVMAAAQLEERALTGGGIHV
jgi:heme exporter protein C